MRRRILRLFVEESLARASAAELAGVLEQPLAQVRYHLETLARCEVLRLAEDDDRDDAEEDHRFGWSLAVEADWLRVVLDVWAEAALPR